jgi:hypothetical protein
MERYTNSIIIIIIIIIMCETTLFTGKRSLSSDPNEWQ